MTPENPTSILVRILVTVFQPDGGPWRPLCSDDMFLNMSDAIPRLNTALEGRYHIERQLGEGGMATVYLADDLKHERKVALKVLKPELAAVVGADRFLGEIKTTANLQHPHILPLFDSGEADGFLFYVMPFIDGETLRDRLDREKQLPIESAVRIASDVAEALHAAHEQGVIHRDIKPANILMSNGEPLVADFGIALAVQQAGGTKLTETGLSVGTPQYMSPEQAAGDRELDGRSDLYSLGCVLYEMLAGEPPHSGPTAQAIYAKVLTDEPRPVTELRATVPRAVSTAVHQALQRLPADRPATGAQLIRILQGSDAGRSSTIGQTRIGQSHSNWRRLAIASTCLAILGLGLAALSWFRPGATTVEGTRQFIQMGSSRTAPDPEFMRNLAISLDGLAIVFRDSVGGVDQLWIKHANSIEAEPLNGTAGGVAPFFSPDGDWIGFFSQVGLRKVQTAGGAPITIAEPSVPERLAEWGDRWAPVGAWADDGTIAFVGFGGGLRVAHASTTGSEVLLAGVGAYGVGQRSISALPGGRGFLYGACPQSCIDPAVWVYDAQTGEPHILIEGASRAWVLPNGRLVYVTQEGSVFIESFDLGALTRSGTPTPLLGGIRVSHRVTDDRDVLLPDIALSPSGRAIYVAGTPDEMIHQVMWVGRDGQSTPVDSSWTFEAAFDGSLALSPDGSHLAIGVRSAGGDSLSDIHVKNLTNGQLERLTTSGTAYRARWTPDGASVTYVHYSDSSSGTLHQKPIGGAGEESEVVRLERTIQEGFMTPDRQWFVVRLGGFPPDLDRDIFAWASEDSTLVPLAVVEGSNQRSPALSPDGRWLAYLSNESGRTEVYVRPFQGGTGRGQQISVAGGFAPLWSRSGQEMFYWDNDGLVSARLSDEVGLSVIERRVLFPLRGRFLTSQYPLYDVAPDDERFVMIGFKLTPGTATGLVMIENLFEN